MVPKNPLELLVAVPLISALASSQPALPSEYPIQTNQNRAIVYAQSHNEKDAAIRKILGIYEKSVIEGDANAETVKAALDFYNNIIKNHRGSSYLPEAYLNSGLIICCILENKDPVESVKRLEEAKKIAEDIETKIKSSYFLARLNLDYAGEGDFTIENARNHINDLIMLVPESELAESLREELKQKAFQKTK